MEIIGTVSGIINNGTIVTLQVNTLEGIKYVHIDHTPFRWMHEAEGGNIVGREIFYDGETVEFL